MTWPLAETPATITPKESPPTTKPLASVRIARPSNEIDELPLKAEGAIGSTAAWPTDAKSITAIIDFIILAVNLVNPAIASLYFRPSLRIAVPGKTILCVTCFNLTIWGNWRIYWLLNSFSELERQASGNSKRSPLSSDGLVIRAVVFPVGAEKPNSSCMRSRIAVGARTH
jgi:hypothetical protein